MCEAPQDKIEHRFKIKDGEDPVEIGEEQAEELKTQEEAYNAHKAFFTDAYGGRVGRVAFIELDTGAELERTKKDLNAQFAPKIVLVNHEKRLNVDVTCSNLGVKFNLIYLSVYQLIREEIEGNTEWGHRLLKEKQEKEITLSFQQKDELQE